MRKETEAFVHGALIQISYDPISSARELRNGISNRVIETSIECSEFRISDSRVVFEGGIFVKSSTALLGVLASAASLGLVAQPPPQPPPPPCTPADNVVCDQQAPEDLVALGPQWIAAGAYSGSGGIVLIRTRDRASHTAYPSSSAANRLDARTYPQCPGPPGEGGARFTTHGVYVAPGNGPVHKLFVVGHGARESIEVFEVDTRPATPAVTWQGCVVAP